MTETTLTLQRKRQLTADTWELLLSEETYIPTQPGQFVNLQLPGKFLRRPISIADHTQAGILLLVRTAGDGTRQLVASEPGTAFPALTALGTGFQYEEDAAALRQPVLIGGGIGLAPLYGLAKTLRRLDLTPTVVLGFRSREDAFYIQEFADLGCCPLVSTEDGSLGIRGFVTDCLKKLTQPGSCCVCGPTAMLKAVAQDAAVATGQFSFEARMGCGFGACMGCTIQTTGGPKRVCADGPVFRKEEIVWERIQ